MSRGFTIIPVSDDEDFVAVGGFEQFSTARLISDESGATEERVYVLTGKDVAPFDDAAVIAEGDIVAVSFDGERWWWPSGSIDLPEREADDDAGQLMRLREEFTVDLKGWTGGNFTSAQCEQHFGLLGIQRTSASEMFSNPKTDDPGPMGPAEPD